MSREALHNLVDIVDEKQIDIIYHILLKFVPEDMPQEDEIRIIEEAKKEIDSGSIYSHEEVWT